MEYNIQKVKERYSDAEREDLRFQRSRASGMEAHYTKRLLDKYVAPGQKILELGCGTGYYGLYLADKCSSYLGVELTPVNVSFFAEKICILGLTNLSVMEGDARSLPELSDESFDVVLVLGPLYHLPPEGREQVLAEAKRLCKPGGTILCAYIPPMGAYLTGVFLRPETYPNETAGEFCLNRQVDDCAPDVWFFTTSKQMQDAAEKAGLQVLQNTGVDFNFCANIQNALPEERVAAWEQLADSMCEDPYAAALASHAVLVCRK
jgi:ubiquinone/menaquinone biosynthesis C-methylase UbiE